jgi:hypothetical protein
MKSFLCACSIIALGAVDVSTAFADSDSVPSTVTLEDPASFSDAQLLMAINVALLVHGGIVYRFKDRASCTVTDRSKRGERFETFYLNNIDASQIAVKPSSLLAADSYVKSIQISISGQRPVYEQHSVWPMQPEMQVAHTLEFGAEEDEFPRVIRAWWFLYSHGCKSGPHATETREAESQKFLIMNKEKRAVYIIDEAKTLAESGHEKDIDGITKDLEDMGFPEAGPLLKSLPVRNELRRLIVSSSP